MKKIFNTKMLLLLVAVMFVGGTIDTLGQRRTRPALRRGTVARKAPVAPRLFTVDTGTRLRARINTTLNSKYARVGQTFTATVTEPVYSSNGVLVVPAGSTLTGRVDAVRAAAKGGKPGTLDLRFTRLRTPVGTSRIINGMLTDLDADDARSDAEGTASGDRMKHRKLIFIGGGGAGGAVLGGAVGGGKGAVIGALLGAGAGYLGQRLTKGEEAEVRSGTEFGVILNQRISLPRFAEVNP